MTKCPGVGFTPTCSRRRKSAVVALFVALALGMLSGCSSEGGIGGTGGGTRVASNPVTFSGNANKGPFVAGAAVAANVVDSAGIVDTNQASAALVAGLGDYELTLEADGVYLVVAEGRYFSEILASDLTETITLRGVVIAASGRNLNVNVLTHLIAGRVLQLMSDGMAADVAVDMASGELIEALRPALPPPANPLAFSELLIMSGLQPASNDEGNAYLLALASIIEQLALDRGEASPQSLLNEMAADLAADGVLAIDAGEFTDAIGRLDPDAIHQGLLTIDPQYVAAGLQMLAEEGGATLDAADVSSADCAVRSDALVCAGSAALAEALSSGAVGPADSTATSVALGSLIANLNLFIDSDADGIVNSLDDDDDNDGVADAEDDSPYGERSSP